MLSICAMQSVQISSLEGPYELREVPEWVHRHRDVEAVPTAERVGIALAGHRPRLQRATSQRTRLAWSPGGEGSQKRLQLLPAAHVRNAAHGQQVLQHRRKVPPHVLTCQHLCEQHMGCDKAAMAACR